MTLPQGMWIWIIIKRRKKTKPNCLYLHTLQSLKHQKDDERHATVGQKWLQHPNSPSLGNLNLILFHFRHLHIMYILALATSHYYLYPIFRTLRALPYFGHQYIAMRFDMKVEWLVDWSTWFTSMTKYMITEIFSYLVWKLEIIWNLIVKAFGRGIYMIQWTQIPNLWNLYVYLRRIFCKNFSLKNTKGWEGKHFQAYSAHDIF